MLLPEAAGKERQRQEGWQEKSFSGMRTDHFNFFHFNTAAAAFFLPLADSNISVYLQYDSTNSSLR
jgi:hypothetical protein